MAPPPRLFEISFAKLSVFNQCRKRYWFRYVAYNRRDPDVMHPNALVGKAVHRGLKNLCLTGQPEDGWSVIDSYLRMPGHECASPGTAAYDDALTFFAKGYEAHESVVSENRWAELPTGYRWRGGGIEVQSWIDRVDRISADEVLIIDWKTGRVDIDDATDTQLDIAHAMIRAAWRLPANVRATAIGWNLRTGEQRARKLTRDHAAGTMRFLSGVAKRMQETTEFEATPSPLCRFCDFRLQCPDAYEHTDWNESADSPADGDDLFEPLEPDDDDLLPFD
jgi:CRISPR/Cas system-associated exonuclease Cas4 (RecB family)